MVKTKRQKIKFITQIELIFFLNLYNQKSNASIRIKDTHLFGKTNEKANQLNIHRLFSIYTIQFFLYFVHATAAHQQMHIFQK